ncbi:hypothetical protein LPB137_10435 [Poseidonibacter parvus]|uniref:PqqD family protein n=1 Tax=Poseidonibacter parvus TaxID=1850254 RepID=A0A1P8KNQ6_9BACT|nr:PqqD family protein [Poseidonibacter parvus]APW66232.1 hypothetical protein LPB137_10435 [Poseidonibacter parvus]
MNLNTKVTIPDTLFSQEVDDETIVLDTNTQEYFNFSSLGKVIWDMLLEENTLQEIFDELNEFMEVEKKQLENDILDFVKSLNERNLIKTSD